MASAFPKHKYPISRYVLALLVEDGICHKVAPNESKKYTWPGFYSTMPDGEDVKNNAICVYDTSPVFFNRDMLTGEASYRYGIQIRCRALNYDEGWQKMEEIDSFFMMRIYKRPSTIIATVEDPANHKNKQNQVSTLTFHSASSTSGIISLGFESNMQGNSVGKYQVFTSNFLLTLDT
jgi:hypothetical protein